MKKKNVNKKQNFGFTTFEISGFSFGSKFICKQTSKNLASYGQNVFRNKKFGAKNFSYFNKGLVEIIKYTHS